MSTNTIERNEQVIAVVKSSTIDVFTTMLGMAITAEEVMIETKNTTNIEGLMAVIGMAGAVSGSGVLCLSEALAFRAASRFLMSEYTEMNDEVLDAVAELCNMIVGGLKTTLEEEFGPMGLSMPTIVFGKDYITRSSSMGERMTVCFRYEEDGMVETFQVVVALIKESSNRNYLRELAKFHAQLT